MSTSNLVLIPPVLINLVPLKAHIILVQTNYTTRPIVLQEDAVWLIRANLLLTLRRFPMPHVSWVFVTVAIRACARVYLVSRPRSFSTSIADSSNSVPYPTSITMFPRITALEYFFDLGLNRKLHSWSATKEANAHVAGVPI